MWMAARGKNASKLQRIAISAAMLITLPVWFIPLLVYIVFANLYQGEDWSVLEDSSVMAAILLLSFSCLIYYEWLIPALVAQWP